jgi:CPA2 family monovalent cation:H+ antiporter-2
MFSAIFFVAIGLMIDPRMVIEYWQPVLVITIAVIVGKVLTCSFGAFVGGNDIRTSLRVGMGLSQIGEFSFIIASLGVTLGVTSGFLYPIAVAVSAITTLLTPYLIKSADGVASWFDRAAPTALVKSLDLYTSWIGQLGSQRHGSVAAKLTWRWTAQMAVNTALVAAVFIAAAFVERRRPEWLRGLGLGEDALKALLWLAAVVISLPMLIATFRKLQAFGLLLAETRVTLAAAGERASAIRAIVAQMVPIAGAVALGLFVLVLSSALLPTFNVMIVLLVIAAFITWLLWRSSIRIYSKAQAALEETFAQTAAPPERRPSALPALLREADLETVTLTLGSPGVGKLIRELELRTRTGASIVGIERGGQNIINPGPDEDLQAGDHVLLLGTRAQLDAAKAAFLDSSEVPARPAKN